MRLQRKLMLVAGALVAAAGAAYGEFVLDIRTPRAALVERHAIATSMSVLIADYDRAAEAMRTRYGPDAQTVLEFQPPRLITRLGDKVVEDRRPPGDFSDAWGLFVIGPRGQLESTFPFRIDPRKAPGVGEQAKPSAQSLKSRFGKGGAAGYLAFDDRDAVTDTCVTISPADLGWPAGLLRFQSGTFCVMYWKGASPGSMLIGVALADGDPWMRPFTRRMCRWLTSAALSRVAATDRAPPPDFAACLLVDRPDRSGATETLREHVYEVRRDATLAYVN
jgi:hypothetical protein